MGLTFAIPDIHGRYDLMNAALVRIRELATSGTVVFLGDYIDRGPDSKKVLDRLMAGPPEGWTWIALRGNHEDMMLEVHDPDHPEHEWWLRNGGETTLESYGGSVDQDTLDWTKSLPRYHEDDHRVFVHATVNEAHDLCDQTEIATQWAKYPAGADVGYRGKHVVHGHHAIGPELYENRTNLDVRAYARDKTYVAVFDDDIPGGPIKHGFVKL